AGIADYVTDGTASEALGAISHARAQLQRGTVALGAYPWSKRKSFLALGALLGVPLLVLLLAQVEAIPVTAQVFAGVSAALALITGALRSVSSWAKVQVDKLDNAEAAIKTDVEKQREKLNESVRAAAERVADAAATVERLSAHDRDLAG